MRNVYKPKVNSGGVKSLKLKRVSLIIIGIFCYALLIIGGTYAYYALTASNNSIAGTAGDADLSLEVVDQHPNNEEYLVPQLEKGLEAAISSNYNCVDDNNNTVCQVYSIKITNTGTATVKINGTITFGNIDKMPNLKWRLIQDKNTYGNYSSHYASLDEARFDSNLTLRKGASKTYYMVIWIDEVDKNQTDTGKYNATIDFSSSNGTGVTSTVGEFNYMKSMGWNSSDYFRSDKYKEKIKTVSFVDYIDTSNAVVQWDMSDLGDNSIVAWLNNNSTNGYYDLYIGSKEEIYIKNFQTFFMDMKEVDSISFDNLNTIQTTSMNYLFFRMGYNSSILKLDLGDKFDTRNVTDMGGMFNSTGYQSSIFTLNLGNKFNTQNVNDMSYMFQKIGYESEKITIDLKNKFDTSSATTMNSMFHYSGYKSPIFTLNLGDKFDTSNVTDMLGMFIGVGYNSKNLTINLGDKFNTSKVTNMGGMFNRTGYNTQNFNLILGDKFTISNVNDIGNLFSEIGYNATNLVLDLSNLTFDSIESYTNFIATKQTTVIYVKSETEKNWILDKNFTGVSSDNVIVKK